VRRCNAPPAATASLWLGSDANTSITCEVIHEGTTVARTPLVALHRSFTACWQDGNEETRGLAEGDAYVEPRGLRS
jgi:hypothetical protein